MAVTPVSTVARSTSTNTDPGATINVTIGSGTGRTVELFLQNFGGTAATTLVGVTCNGSAMTVSAARSNSFGRPGYAASFLVPDGGGTTAAIVPDFSAANATWQILAASHSGVASILSSKVEAWSNGVGTSTNPKVDAITSSSGARLVGLGFDGQFNGTTIAGANGSTVVASEAPGGNAWQLEQDATGTTSSIEGTIGTASVWSMGAFVLVPAVTGPTINTQPSNQTVTAPATATFTVAATASSGSLTYQWQVNTGSGFTNVSTGTGGTTASYTTPATSGSMNGYTYQCIVTDSGGSVTTTVATLTVNVGGSNASRAMYFNLMNGAF